MRGEGPTLNSQTVRGEVQPSRGLSTGRSEGRVRFLPK